MQLSPPYAPHPARPNSADSMAEESMAKEFMTIQYKWRCIYGDGINSTPYMSYNRFVINKETELVQINVHL